jgi:hypothetical protein
MADFFFNPGHFVRQREKPGSRLRFCSLDGWTAPRQFNPSTQALPKRQK